MNEKSLTNTCDGEVKKSSSFCCLLFSQTSSSWGGEQHGHTNETQNVDSSLYDKGVRLLERDEQPD